MYTESQKQALAEDLKGRVSGGFATDYEIIITLLVFQKKEFITVEDIPNILFKIFNNQDMILKALSKIPAGLNDKLLDDIIADVEGKKENIY
jgi:hypothetical protein